MSFFLSFIFLQQENSSFSFFVCSILGSLSSRQEDRQEGDIVNDMTTIDIITDVVEEEVVDIITTSEYFNNKSFRVREYYYIMMVIVKQNIFRNEWVLIAYFCDKKASTFFFDSSIQCRVFEASRICKRN